MMKKQFVEGPNDTLLVSVPNTPMNIYWLMQALCMHPMVTPKVTTFSEDKKEFHVALWPASLAKGVYDDIPEYKSDIDTAINLIGDARSIIAAASYDAGQKWAGLPFAGKDQDSVEAQSLTQFAEEMEKTVVHFVQLFKILKQYDEVNRADVQDAALGTVAPKNLRLPVVPMNTGTAMCTELTARMILSTKDDYARGFNEAMAWAVRLNKRYQAGDGLFQ